MNPINSILLLVAIYAPYNAVLGKATTIRAVQIEDPDVTDESDLGLKKSTLATQTPKERNWTKSEAKQGKTELRERIKASPMNEEEASRVEFLSSGWHALSEDEYNAYKTLLGQLTNKLSTHATIIEAYERGERESGQKPSKFNAPLGFNVGEWLVVQHLGPAISLAKGAIADGTIDRDALRTLKRLLKVAGEAEERRHAALFSKEVARRLHSLMVKLVAKLYGTPYKELPESFNKKVSLDEAMLMVDELLQKETEGKVNDGSDYYDWDMFNRDF